MTISISPKAAWCDADNLFVELADGRTIGAPLAWFPRLADATPAQRKKVRLTSRGLHWDALDEDISVAGLLAGLGDQTVPGRARRAPPPAA